MKVTYKDHMGSDLTVVNAARVSFAKESVLFDDSDKKLLSYLAKHGHWSPFAHCTVQVHVKAPIFVARQLAKHQVGMSWNEVSRRYVKNDVELYWPEKWRKAAENVKQGSSDEDVFIEHEYIKWFGGEIIEEYSYLLRCGVCPEQARMILPQNMYTEWYWTGSLYAFARVFNQRTHEGAQKETQEIAHQIGSICAQRFPVSWEVLTKEQQ